MALTKEQALEAYSSKESASTIAKTLGVDEGTVRKIRLKKTWKKETDAYDRENVVSGGTQGEAVSPDHGGRGAEVVGEAVSAGADRAAYLAEGVAPQRADDGPDGQGRGDGGEGPAAAPTAQEEGHPGHTGEGGAQPLVATSPIPFSGDEATQAEAMERIDAAFLASEPYGTGTPDMRGIVSFAPDGDGGVSMLRASEPAPVIILDAAGEVVGGSDPFTAPDGRRDFFPATLPPKPKRERRVQKDGEPRAPSCPPGLEARFVKVLIAAKQYGVVRGLHGYGGKTLTDPATIISPERREEIERINEAFMPSPALARQLRLGLIAPGEHANTFVLTDAGKARLAEHDAYMDEYNAYLNRMAEWRREVRRKTAAEHELAGDAA